MSTPNPTESLPREPRGAERRRHPRVPFDWPVTIALPDGEHEARLRDVSRAGVCFFLDRQIPEMTVLRLVVDLPECGSGPARSPEHTVRGSGVVVRCRALSPHVDHYEIAVFLNDISELDRARLEAFVQAQRDAG